MKRIKLEPDDRAEYRRHLQRGRWGVALILVSIAIAVWAFGTCAGYKSPIAKPRTTQERFCESPVSMVIFYAGLGGMVVGFGVCNIAGRDQRRVLRRAGWKGWLW